MTKTPSAKYLRFFKENIRKPHVFVQGGRRSGKSFTELWWVDVLTSMAYGLNIIVMTHQFPALQAVMKDFGQCLGYPIRGEGTRGLVAHGRNGSVWQFVHCDDKTKAQGTQCDILIANESLNIPDDVMATMVYGVRRQIYYNFNPSKSYKYMDDRLADGSGALLCTTFRDNPYLTEQQYQEFENIKQRAMRKNATKHDIYQYQVYYLGNFATMVGAIFGSVERMTVEEYRQIPAQEILGMDFGFATDGDPTTLVGCKVCNGRIYLHQYIYEQGLTSDEELCQRIYDLGFNPHTMILADYGGMGHGRIDNLRTGGHGRWTGELRRGLSVCNAIKTQIMDGLSQMLSMDGITITETSDEMIGEFEAYEREDNGKFRGADHAIDAARYAFTYAHRVL